MTHFVVHGDRVPSRFFEKTLREFVVHHVNGALLLNEEEEEGATNDTKAREKCPFKSPQTKTEERGQGETFTHHP